MMSILTRYRTYGSAINVAAPYFNPNPQQACRSNVPVERQQIDPSDRRKDSQLSALTELLDRDLTK